MEALFLDFSGVNEGQIVEKLVPFWLGWKTETYIEMMRYEMESMTESHIDLILIDIVFVVRGNSNGVHCR